MQYRLNHSSYYCHVLLKFVIYRLTTPTDNTQKERRLSAIITFKPVRIYEETWKEAVVTKFNTMVKFVWRYYRHLLKNRRHNLWSLVGFRTQYFPKGRMKTCSYISPMPGRDSNKAPPQSEADTSQLRQPTLSKRSITRDIIIEFDVQVTVHREKFL